MHYCVLVTAEKNDTRDIRHIIGEKLAPYSEHIQVEPYISYTAEKVKEKQKELQKRLQEDGDSFIKDHETAIMSDSVVEFAKEWYGEDTVDNEGNVYSTYNPKSQWDWYEIGGRWSGMLRTKDGGIADYAKVKEVDWDKMKQNSLKDAEESWREIEESEELPIRYVFSGYEKGMAKEEFIDMMTAFSTYAVLTKDGEWKEKDDENKEQYWDRDFKKKYLDTLDEEDVIVIVDCHI